MSVTDRMHSANFLLILGLALTLLFGLFLGQRLPRTSGQGPVTAEIRNPAAENHRAASQSRIDAERTFRDDGTSSGMYMSSPDSGFQTRHAPGMDASPFGPELFERTPTQPQPQPHGHPRTAARRPSAVNPSAFGNAVRAPLFDSTGIEQSIQSLTGIEHAVRELDTQSIATALNGLNTDRVASAIEQIDTAGLQSSIKSLSGIEEAIRGMDVQSLIVALQGMETKSVATAIEKLDTSGVETILHEIREELSNINAITNRRLRYEDHIRIRELENTVSMLKAQSSGRATAKTPAKPRVAVSKPQDQGKPSASAKADRKNPQPVRVAAKPPKATRPPLPVPAAGAPAGSGTRQESSTPAFRTPLELPNRKTTARETTEVIDFDERFVQHDHEFRMPSARPAPQRLAAALPQGASAPNPVSVPPLATPRAAQVPPTAKPRRVMPAIPRLPRLIGRNAQRIGRNTQKSTSAAAHQHAEICPKCHKPRVNRGQVSTVRTTSHQASGSVHSHRVRSGQSQSARGQSQTVRPHKVTTCRTCCPIHGQSQARR